MNYIQIVGVLLFLSSVTACKRTLTSEFTCAAQVLSETEPETASDNLIKKLLPRMLEDLQNGKIDSHTLIGPHERTALHQAVLLSSKHVLPYLLLLLQKGANPNAQDDLGLTPLHIAAEQGSLWAVQSLLEGTGVNVNATDIKGWTPLHHAAYNGHQAIVICLLRHAEIDLHATNNYCQQTALHLAARKGHTDIVITLLSCPSCSHTVVNQVDRIGKTALYYAACEGHAAIVKCLVQDLRTEVNVENKYGETALHIATYKGFENIVTILLGHSKIQAGLPDQNGATALHHAAEQGYSVIVNALLQAGVNVHATTKIGFTALDHAVYYNKPYITNIFLSHLHIINLNILPSGKVKVAVDDTEYQNRS